MMYTEDEAKQKVCWKKLGHQPSEFNQDVFCEGSQCMAWRWGGLDHWRKTPLGGGHFSNQPEGYCGLAGKPEGKE